MLLWPAIVCSTLPKPYSYDFPQKVIQAIELDGLKKQEASELLVNYSISAATRSTCGWNAKPKREMLYLPAYSPDFNKIERCSSRPGSRIRKQLEQFECLRDAMEYVLHKGVLTAGRGCYNK